MTTLSKELIESMKDGMKPTGLDRAIARVFPGWGLRRLQARTFLALGGAWSGSRLDTAEMKNFTPLNQSPDREMIWDREWQIKRASDLERNDAVAGGTIAELQTSVVGTGLSLHLEPRTKILGWTQDQAAEWSQGVMERFTLWAQDPRECDISRRRNFWQSQSMAYKTTLTRGDAFALLLKRKHPGTVWATKFQLVEGDRVRNPLQENEFGDVTQGVELDEVGGFKTYWFTKKYPNGLTALSPDDFVAQAAWDSEGRRQVLHLFNEHRLDVRRGYPLLGPVIVVLKQLSRLTDAELAAAVVTSFFAVLIKKSSGGPGPLGGSVQRDSNNNAFTELGPAILADLAPGEEIQQVSPVRPNAAFDPFWRSLVGQISLRTQIPPEVLLKKFESSYTAARGALLQFWKHVNCERENLLAPNYCQPLFEAWLAEDVASGRTVAPGFFQDPLLRAAFSNARWVGDNPPILDPLKEVLAAEELVDYGFSTYSEQTTRLTAGDFESNTERLAREVRLRKSAGLAPPNSHTAPGEGKLATDNLGVDPNADSSAPADQAAPKNPPEGRRAALLALAMGESR